MQSFSRRLHFKSKVVVLCALAIAFPIAADEGAKGPDVSFGFAAETGQVSISLDGKEVTVAPGAAQNGKVRPLRVWFRDADAKVPLHGYDRKIDAIERDYWKKTDEQDQDILKANFDRAQKKLTHTYRWGEVSYQYQPGKSSLDWAIQVTNRSPKTIWQMQFSLLYLGLSKSSGPAKITESYFGRPSQASKAIATFDPVVLPMLDGNRAIVACSPEMQKPLVLQWIPPSWYRDYRKLVRHNDPEAQELADAHEKALKVEVAGSVFWRLMLTVGGDQLITHQRYSSRPIPSGKSDTFQVSLRFGDARTPMQPGKDIIDAFAKRHPMRLKWEDRRPIVRSFIGDWFPFHLPSGPEFKKPEGIKPTKEFRDKVLKSADTLIEDAKAIDAQGMILWNVEGRNSRWVGYVGDPRIVEYRCPEMDAVADEFFAKIRAAGLRTGVCLRPTTIIIRKIPDEWKGFRKKHNVKTDWILGHKYSRKPGGIIDELSAKVKYAQKRWGCTLFYVDTNKVAFLPEKDEEARWPKYRKGSRKGKFIRYSALMNAAQWEELHRRHPDCLFVVEHSNFLYYRSIAPYDQFNMGSGSTPPLARAVWPKAFKCRSLEARDLPRHYQGLVDSYRDGDIVLPNPGCRYLASSFTDARNEAKLQNQPPPARFNRMPEADLLATAVSKEADSASRYFAARALLQRKVAPEAVKALLQSHDRLVVRMAFGKIDGKDYVPLINTLLDMWKASSQRKDQTTVAMIQNATGRIGPAAIDPLTDMTGPEDILFAIRALAAMRRPNAIAAIRKIIAQEKAKPKPNKRSIARLERELKKAKK